MSRVHIITGEQSRFRRWALYIFARYIEMPMLAWAYRLLRGRLRWLGRRRLVRFLLGWLVAAPVAHLGDTGRPMPLPQVLEMIDALDGPIAVGPCRCRLSHGGCDHPMETDIVIRTGVAAWTRAFPHQYRRIEKDEARRIVTACAAQGMWQMVFIHCPVNQENEYAICNCCTCGCVPTILNRELGQRVFPLLLGDFIARVDPSRCAGHGDCVTACPFDALTLVQGKAHLVDLCYGCGRCVAACPEQAIHMVAKDSG